MKDMTDEEYEKKMEWVKEHLNRIHRGKPPSKPKEPTPEHYADKDLITVAHNDGGDIHIVSPGFGGRTRPSTIVTARSAVAKMLREAGATSFTPEFDELFDQVEKIARRKK